MLVAGVSAGMQLLDVVLGVCVAVEWISRFGNPRVIH